MHVWLFSFRFTASSFNGGGRTAPAAHVVVEDVMETDNNDEELSSERERERRRKVHWEREREPEVEMHGGKRRLIRFVRGTILRVCSLSLLKRPTLGVRRKRHFMSGCTSREYGNGSTNYITNSRGMIVMIVSLAMALY